MKILFFAECILFRGGPVRRRRMVIIIKRVMIQSVWNVKRPKPNSKR